MAAAVVTAAVFPGTGHGQAQEPASGGYLLFFADEQDAAMLWARLSADPEIAFIVPDGPPTPPQRQPTPAPPSGGDRPHAVATVAVPDCDGGDWQRWRTVKPLEALKAGKHILWHVPSGPLLGDFTVLHGNRYEYDLRPIADPWAGWSSPRPACAPNIEAAGTIRLTLETRYAAYTPEERATVRPLISRWTHGDLLVASEFEWTGGSLQPDGYRHIARWAAALKEWFSQNAVGLRTRDGSEVVWALPSALARLKAGMPYSANNHDLDEAIGAPPGFVKVVIEHPAKGMSLLQAYHLGRSLKRFRGVDVTYRISDGDVFEVSVDDVLRLSEKQLGRLPTREEMAALTNDVEALAAAGPRH